MRVFVGGLGLLMVMVAACGSDEEIQVSSDSAVYCAGYDDQCGPSTCSVTCNRVMPSAFSPCWLYACGAAVNKCDNEEPGNRSILGCAQDQGWNVACQQLQNQCNNCGDARPARCQTIVGANNADACINLLAGLDQSTDGCTDPTP